MLFFPLITLLSLINLTFAKINTQSKKEIIPWERLVDEDLCPPNHSACPIAPRMTSYECLDTSNELFSCGGCSSRNEGQDCTAIKNTIGTTCAFGRCKITCERRYQLVTNVYGTPSCVLIKRKSTV